MPLKFPHTLLFTTVLVTAAPLTSGGALSQSTSSLGCKAINDNAANFAIAAPASGRQTGSFQLQAGERVSFLAVGSAGASGSITLADEASDPQPILAGEVPQSAIFTAPAPGAYRFRYHAASGSITITARCEAADIESLSALSAPGSFLDRRAERLLSEDTAQTSLQRRAAGAPAAPDKAVRTTTVVDDEGNPRQIVVSTSAAALGAAQGAAPKGKLDFWVDARLSRYEERIEEDGHKLEKSGRFGMAYVGADYLVRENVLVGALVQFDELGEDVDGHEASIQGNGFMAGPYASIRLAPDVVFDARAAWGKSSNWAETAGSGSFGFETDRQLVSGRLIGNRKLGGFELSPSVSFGLVEESLASGAEFPDGETAGSAIIGRLGLGSALSYRFALEDGGFLQPRFALSTAWSAEDFDSLAALSNSAGAKAEAGFTLGNANGFDLQASGSLEGISENSFSGWSTRLGLKTPLN